MPANRASNRRFDYNHPHYDNLQHGTASEQGRHERGRRKSVADTTISLLMQPVCFTITGQVMLDLRRSGAGPICAGPVSEGTHFVLTVFGPVMIQIQEISMESLRKY